MKKKTKRVVKPGVLIHCYQRTQNGLLLFYSISDYLVYFTIYSVNARRYGIQVLSLNLMPDHVHESVMVNKSNVLSRFKRKVNSSFAKVHNEVCHTSGQLFEEPFGSALKHGDKAERTNLVYVGNNPVERRLSKRAEDYQWGFIPYSQTPNPFSNRLVIRDSRWPLRKAVKEVRLAFKAGRPMTYRQLQRLFKPLELAEKKQLTDFIVTTYSVIDYQAAIDRFGSYEKMIMAMHSTTGSEHDIQETFTGKSDEYYAKMISIVLRETGEDDIHNILSYDKDKKWQLFQLLRQKTFATSRQIAKFLRIQLESV